jgi:hypothetical protein
MTKKEDYSHLFKEPFTLDTLDELARIAPLQDGAPFTFRDYMAKFVKWIRQNTHPKE